MPGRSAQPPLRRQQGKRFLETRVNRHILHIRHRRADLGLNWVEVARLRDSTHEVNCSIQHTILLQRAW